MFVEWYKNEMEENGMKKLVALLMTIIMVLGLVACGGNDTSKDNGEKDEASTQYDWTKGADESGGNVTIRVATWRINDEPYYQEIIRRFEEKYSWIDVELEIIGVSSTYYSNLQADLVGGSAPDVFDTHPNSRLLEYAKAGLIAPQTDFDYMKNYREDAELVTKIYGENYGYMNAYNYFGFLYNKDILAQAGLSAPTTPEEFVAAVNTLKGMGYGGAVYCGKSNNSAIAEACLMITLGTEGYGKLLEGIDNGTITDIAEVEGVEEALNTLQYYLTEDIFYTSWEGISYESGMSLYAQEKSAFAFAGSYIFGEKDVYFPNVDTGFFPVPTYSGTGLTYTQGAQTSCINAASKNLGAAKLWVEFLATPEISEYYCSNAKMFSTINDVEPVFDEAEMLLNSCNGYAARAITERENGEYWTNSWQGFLEGILEGQDWQSLNKVLRSKLEEFDLANL